MLAHCGDGETAGVNDALGEAITLGLSVGSTVLAACSQNAASTKPTPISIRADIANPTARACIPVYLLPNRSCTLTRLRQAIVG
jgi:hypothetical protein